MALSILHRITGIAIAVGLLLVVWLLLGLANGPQSYAAARAFCGSWFGLVLLFGRTAGGQQGDQRDGNKLGFHGFSYG